MATNEECNCINNALRTVNLATEMKDAAFYHIQYGRDIDLKKTMYTSPPEGTKTILDIINKDANLLNEEIVEMETNCRLNLSGFKRDIKEVINSKGRNLDAAYIVGDSINYTMGAVIRKKLCGD